MWSQPELWDVMVKQIIAICRSQGIMAIDGVHYLSAMEKDIDGWHVAKTDANVDKIGNMIFDVLHAAIACIPWGSFATLQPIPEASWSQDPTFAAIATTGAFSTQVGASTASTAQAAASSTQVGTAVADATEEEAPP